jgi:nucleoside permease NupC
MAKIISLLLLGFTNWGTEGKFVTGASGLLDRVDALCFAAPVFFTLYGGILVSQSASRSITSCTSSS